jgi:hypothetical protein
MESALFKGAVDKLDMAIAERIERLGQVAKQMPESIRLYKKITPGRGHQETVQSKREFFEKWADMERVFNESIDREGEPFQKEAFLNILDKAIIKNGKNYLMVIKGLAEAESSIGTVWLQGLVDKITNHVLEILPSLGEKGQ